MGALKEAARKGRGGDTRLGHLTNGDIVFPAERVDERTKQVIHAFMKSQGIKDPGRFTVGDKANVKNPKTRLPQFEEGDTGQSGGGGGGQTGPGGADTGTGGGGGIGAAPGGIQGGQTPGSVTDPVGGPTVSDPSTGSTTPGIGTNAGSLTGQESATAVESGTIPGTPPATPDQNTGLQAANMGVLGQFGQPSTGLGLLDGAINSIGGIPGLADIGLGMLPGVNIAELVSKGLFGRGILGTVSNLSQGGQPGGLVGAIGPGDTPSGPAPPGMNDTGAGLSALGGGIGVDLSELLKNRLGGAQ